jgi:hypothetical protein
MGQPKTLIPALNAIRRASIRSMIYVAALVAAATTTLSAQTPVPLGVDSRSEVGLDRQVPDSSHLDRDPNYLKRIAPAAVVGIGSAIALGAVAHELTDCSGDSCYGAFFGVALPAALFGGIIGSAAGAAAPRGRGLCTGLQRFGMGVGGAFLGTLAGFPLAMATGPFGMMATVPIGSVMFMRRC